MKAKKTIKIKRNRVRPYKIKPPKKRPVGRPPGTTKNDIKITEKEQLFANLILDNMLKTKKTKMNQTECYRIAFQNYTMKDNSAQVTASNLLRKPRIHSYIQERKKAAAGRVEINQARVLRGLLRIAEFDLRKLFDSKGRPIPVHKLDSDTALGISSMDFGTISKRLPSGRRKILYYPKKFKAEARKPAWELLGQHLNMWENDNQQSTAEDFINSVREFTDSITNAIPGGKL